MNFCRIDSNCYSLYKGTKTKYDPACGCTTTDTTWGCIFPEIKKALLYGEGYNQDSKIEDKKIKKYYIEVEAHDKFHVTYPPNTYYTCRIWIGDFLLCEFKTLCTSSNQTLTYEFEPNRNLNNLFKNNQIQIKCQLMSGDDIACPKELTLILFYDD